MNSHKWRRIIDHQIKMTWWFCERCKERVVSTSKPKQEGPFTIIEISGTWKPRIISDCDAIICNKIMSS